MHLLATEVRNRTRFVAGLPPPRDGSLRLQSQACAQREGIHPVLASARLTGRSYVCVAAGEGDLARRIESVPGRKCGTFREARPRAGAEELNALPADPNVGVRVPSQLTPNPATALTSASVYLRGAKYPSDDVVS
jgi:predicted component of type VI protein secretion system